MRLCQRRNVQDLIGDDGLDALETSLLGLDRIAPDVKSVTSLTALYTARAWEFLVQDRASERRWHLSLEHLSATLKVRAVASPEPTR